MYIYICVCVCVWSRLYACLYRRHEIERKRVMLKGKETNKVYFTVGFNVIDTCQYRVKVSHVIMATNYRYLQMYT